MNQSPGRDLSIIIPLYNEQDCVKPLFAALGEAFADVDRLLEIILVDDGSRDQTYRTAVAESETTDLPVKIISLQRNFGQTAAMQAGIDAATGRLIATLDGDLQNDPADIPAMVQALEDRQLDLLVGRRAKRQDGLVLRLIPSWIANRLIAMTTGVRISDYGCSLKIYRGDVIRQIRLIGEMHRFIPAWVAAVTDPSRIGEMDVRHRARQFGSSKYGISRTIRVVIDLLSVLFFMRYRNRPGHFFGSCGMLVGGLGMSLMAMLLVSKFLYGQDIGTRPLLLIAVVAILSSLQLICFGVMAEMLARNSNTGPVSDVASQRLTSHQGSSHRGSSHRGYWVREQTMSASYPSDSDELMISLPSNRSVITRKAG
ncbi:glycosyltransferase family 2 protein [Neorhodopirellula pilleata]|uniref:Undecaprenyl-phosphate 4-deoxy-4-formamido-L-arabinose transferase n=1 Tax=Neorhodopirellula pilleata TaxID=2714738 RepID=A0A5C6A995_9BACT|nr:glycosyltransferase family 2 protein [Neorhodopirellula pilleata]TWT95611.1 Undecaprenyl-phosphate 4-deoxy-4-formamido-L-arabinose transferase [Neorhodopirellula pilleata]